MSVLFKKNGDIVISNSNKKIDNMYPGKQYNMSNAKITYDFKTDLFKQYGYNSAMKLEPTRTADGQTAFLCYSYILPDVEYDKNSVYSMSLYAYCSNDCNANIRINLEHSCAWVNTSTGSAQNINISTKGKVVYIWGIFKPNQTDGKIYLMFYPNMNQVDTFTSGYQLFTGISIYKGTEIFRPTIDGVSDGLLAIPGKKSIYENRIEFDDFMEI